MTLMPSKALGSCWKLSPLLLASVMLSCNAPSHGGTDDVLSTRQRLTATASDGGVCWDDLKKNPVYACVTSIPPPANLANPPPSYIAAMEACGCTLMAIGGRTGIGTRPTFACGGQPPFFVSPTNNNGAIGIIPVNPAGPDCMADVSTNPDGGGGTPIVPQTDTCSDCHDPAKPYKPVRALDGGYPWDGGFGPPPDAGTIIKADAGTVSNPEPAVRAWSLPSGQRFLPSAGTSP